MVTLVELTAQAFADGGPLETVMRAAGRKYRPSQIQRDYAAAVARNFSDAKPGIGEVALLESDTGAGKTLGYLVPMALHCATTNRRALVSTHTLALQHQIVSIDAPIAATVAALVGRQPVVAVRKGMANFFSPSRIKSARAALAAEEALTDTDEEGLDKLYEFAKAGGDLADWRDEFGPLPAHLPESEVCLLASCGELERGAYDAHVLAANSADIVVTNHALLMLAALRRFALLPGEFDIGVVDEADTVPAAAEGVFNARVSAQMLESVAKGIEDDAGDARELRARIKDWTSWVTGEYDTLRTNHGFVHDGDGGALLLSNPNMKAVREKAAGFASSLEHTLIATHNRAKSDGVKTGKLQEALNLAAELNSFVVSALGAPELGPSSYQTPTLRWSPVKTFPSFSVTPVYPGRLAGRLFKSPKDGAPFLRSVIFTSATLDAPVSKPEAPGVVSFKNFRDEIGLFYHSEYPEQSAHISPENSLRFSHRRFGTWTELHLADCRAPSPSPIIEEPKEGEDEKTITSNPEWLDYAAAGIEAAHGAGGRTLVLATSYNDTKELAERVRARGLDVIEHKRGTKLAVVLEMYRATSRALLISPGAWAGVDLPGLVQNLVVTKVPFTPPDSAKFAAKRAILRQRGMTDDAIGGILYVKATGDTMKKLKQGFGRAIRNFEDQSAVWVLDPRFPRPSTITSDWKSVQVNDGRFGMLSACIPERFLNGKSAVYPKATVFEVPVTAANVNVDVGKAGSEDAAD